MKFIEKYKKKLIIASISAGIVLQLGGAYGGCVVYRKFKKIERQERVLKAKLKRLKKHQAEIVSYLHETAKIINAHSKDLLVIVPKVEQIEKKLRRLERKWK